MPEFITEDAYLEVEDLINNPPPGTTDFYLTEWKKHQNNYKNQQFRANINDLTPNKTALAGQKQYEDRQRFADIYSKGIEAYDINQEPDPQFLTTPDIIGRRVNRKFLSTIYGENVINGENHDLYRTDFAKRFLNREDILNDEQFFEAVKPYAVDSAAKDKVSSSIQQQAVVNYYSGVPLSESLKQLRTLGTPNEGEIKQLYGNMDAVIAPYRPYIDSALNALERQTKGQTQPSVAGPVGRPLGGRAYIPQERIGKVEITKTEEDIAAERAEDEKAISDLRDALLKAHPSNRVKIMKKMMGEAQSRGKATIDEVRNLYNEAVDSAKNVFEGLEIFEDMNQEIGLRKMQFTAGEEVEVSIPGFTKITTPEEARQVVLNRLTSVISEGVPGKGALPTASVYARRTSKITLDEKSSKLLRDAKADLLSTLEFDRDVRGLEKAVDPFREGWQTTMATTVGSSVAIMGMYALASLGGPAGTAGALGVTGALYTGLNYEEIRAKYPDLAPDKARNVAIVSGGIEALLDLAQYRIISAAFGKFGKKPMAELISRGAAGTFTREVAQTTIKTYIFELGIEVLQEGARPLVQEIFAQYDKEYSTNISEEWADWKSAVPHIAIGMIPLAMVGGLGAGSKRVFNDSLLKKEILRDGSLTTYGLSNEQAAEIQELANNNMLDAARERIRELSKDENVLARREQNRIAFIERENARVGSETIRAYTEGRREGLIPRYTQNEQGQYVLEDGTVFEDQKGYISHIESKLNEEEKNYTDSTVDAINGDETAIDIDFAELERKTNLLGRLKGMSQSELASLDNVFGETELDKIESNNNLVANMAEKGIEGGLRAYIDGIYDNLPETVKISLGQNREESVNNLYKVVTGQAAAIKSESDVTNMSFNIDDSVSKDSLQFDTAAEGVAAARNLPASFKAMLLDVFLTQGESTPLYDEVLKLSKSASMTADEYNIKFEDLYNKKFGLSDERWSQLGYDKLAINELNDTTSGPDAGLISNITKIFRERYGVNVVFFSGPTGKYAPFGAMAGGRSAAGEKTLLINVGKTRGKLLPFVLGHEFSHHLQFKYADVWTKLRDEIIPKIDPKAYEEYSRILIEGPDYKEDQIKAEFIADTFGSRFADRDFWDKLATELAKSDPNQAISLIRAVKDFFNIVRGGLTELAPRLRGVKGLSDMENIESAIVRTMMQTIGKAPTASTSEATTVVDDDSGFALMADIDPNNVGASFKRSFTVLQEHDVISDKDQIKKLMSKDQYENFLKLEATVNKQNLMNFLEDPIKTRALFNGNKEGLPYVIFDLVVFKPGKESTLFNDLQNIAAYNNSPIFYVKPRYATRNDNIKEHVLNIKFDSKALGPLFSRLQYILPNYNKLTNTQQNSKVDISLTNNLDDVSEQELFTNTVDLNKTIQKRLTRNNDGTLNVFFNYVDEGIANSRKIKISWKGKYVSKSPSFIAVDVTTLIDPVNNTADKIASHFRTTSHEFGHSIFNALPKDLQDIFYDYAIDLITKASKDGQWLSNYNKFIDANYKKDKRKQELLSDLTAEVSFIPALWNGFADYIIKSKSPKKAKGLIKKLRTIIKNSIDYLLDKYGSGSAAGKALKSIRSIEAALKEAPIKHDITNPRVFDPSVFTDFDQLMNSFKDMVIDALDRRVDTVDEKIDQQNNEISYMRDIIDPDAENRSVDYISRKLKDQINYALYQLRRAEQAGLTPQQIADTFVEPNTTERFERLVKLNERKYRRLIKKEVSTANVGRALRRINKKVYDAVIKGQLTMSVFAEAEAAVRVASERSDNPIFNPFEGYKALMDSKQTTSWSQLYLKDLNGFRGKMLEDYVNGPIKKTFNDVLASPVFKSNRMVYEVINTINDALFGDMTDIQGKLSSIYNQLYTPDGIPVELSQEDFEMLTTKYHIYKSFGGWQNRAIDEREAVITKASAWTKLIRVDQKYTIEDIELTNVPLDRSVDLSIDEIVSNDNTIGRYKSEKFKGVEVFFSYADDHLTFASLLELVSPSLNTPGQPITENLQGISDLFIDSYHNIQDEVHSAQDGFINIVESAYKYKDTSTGTGLLKKKLARKKTSKKLYNLLTEKNIKVNLNGQEQELTQAFGAYILNIADQMIYETQLNNAGFDVQAIIDIQSQLEPEMNEIREALRKDLISIVKRANRSYASFGKPVIDPGEFFYPVEKKSLTNRVISNFDIAYGTALQPDDINNLITGKDDIELDLESQTINLFTMFNSHSYISIHGSNVAAPVLAAKKIFSNPAVRSKLESKIGSEGIARIFGSIRALEFGGISSSEMLKGTRQFLDNMISGAARAQLGFNLRTYAVNLVSAINFLQDASIPMGLKAKSLRNVIGGLLSKEGRSQLRGVKNGKLLRRRLRAGANSLMAIVKGDITLDRPSLIRTMSDISMEAISEIDAAALTISSLAAYNAYIEIGKSRGLDGEELERFAEKGMVRSITKTSQPNNTATKSYIEQSSNPYLRILSLYLSEPRKAFGLEYAALKKAKVKPGELLQMLLVNHLILGTSTYLLREGATWLLTGEDFGDDPEDLFISIMLGPLSGLMAIGGVFGAVIKEIYNQIAEGFDLPKVRIFGSEPAPIRTATQITSLKKTFGEDRALSERVSGIGETLEAIGSVFNQSTTSSTGSFIDAIGDAIKMLTERGEE
jgi:hypothetical protein